MKGRHYLGQLCTFRKIWVDLAECATVIRVSQLADVERFQAVPRSSSLPFTLEIDHLYMRSSKIPICHCQLLGQATAIRAELRGFWSGNMAARGALYQNREFLVMICGGAMVNLTDMNTCPKQRTSVWQIKASVPFLL